jgi:hypothetical protein
MQRPSVGRRAEGHGLRYKGMGNDGWAEATAGQPAAEAGGGQPGSWAARPYPPVDRRVQVRPGG